MRSRAVRLTLLLLFVAGIILLWFTTTAEKMHEGDGPEFFALLLGATLGMSLMASASNLLMLFMAVELASLPSYVLAGFRKTNRIGAEALHEPAADVPRSARHEVAHGRTLAPQQEKGPGGLPPGPFSKAASSRHATVKTRHDGEG